MATFVIVHGAADSGWSWHLVARELLNRGHQVDTPDLPCEDDSAGFPDYAEAVVDALGNRSDLIIVAHSLGGYTATLVADRRPVLGLVLVSAMIPAPGEPANDWWTNSGFKAFSAAATTEGDAEPLSETDQFYNGVSPELVTESGRHARGQSGTPMSVPWPLSCWPDVSTRFIICTEDRFFPPAFMRQVVADRLPDVVPDETPGGHMAMLSHPVELARLLDRYSRDLVGSGQAE